MWYARTTRITKEDGETCSAKRTHASRKPKAGNGKGSKGRSTKYEGRKGMVCGMRNSDCGMVISRRDHEPRFMDAGTAAESRTRRKRSVAKRTHRAVNPRPLLGCDACCLTRRRAYGRTQCRAVCVRDDRGQCRERYASRGGRPVLHRGRGA